MVHRSADARLLSNLVSHEKDYSKQLQTLLTASQASLGSLTAYAAASPPATSRTILNVAAILSAADSAHQRYASAVEEWRDMLRGLHALEEEVANVIRDREILVTRLIKASKSSTKSASSSASHLLSPSGSSLNLNAIPGTSTKLAAAQSELQACETHLATKERELDVRRVQVIRDGLILRGRAMSETGWTWSQLGREAINTVETELGLRNEPQRHQQNTRHEDSKSPGTSVSTHASSSFPGGYPTSSSEDSGGKAGELNIPAAHAISSEIDMPIPVMNSTNSTPSRRNSTTLSPRNSMSVQGPPVPSKRSSFHGLKPPNSTTPRHSRLFEPSDLQQQPLSALQHRPHLQHVAPHGRVSWASVTDTEEDWADAGEGGEELDAAFGRPSSNNAEASSSSSHPRSNGPTNHSQPMLTDKELPSPPPPTIPSSKYPFAQAPGSIFDSPAYRGAKEELVVASRPTSMAYSDGPPPVIRVSSGGSGGRDGLLQVPRPRSFMDERDTTEDGLDVDGRRSMTYSNRTSEASEVEFVGKATRFRFAVEDPTVLSTVPASPLSGAAEGKEGEKTNPMEVATTLVPAQLKEEEAAVPAEEEPAGEVKLTKRAKKKQRRKEKGKQRMTEQQELEEQQQQRELEQREAEERAKEEAAAEEPEEEAEGEDEEEEVVEVKTKNPEKAVEIVEVTQPVVLEHRGVLVEVVQSSDGQQREKEEEEDEESLDQDEEDRMLREGLLTVVENPRFSAAPAVAVVLPTAAASTSASAPPAPAVEGTSVSAASPPSAALAPEAQQTPAPVPVAETQQPVPPAATEESVNAGEGKQTVGKKKEKKRSSMMAALFHPMGGPNVAKVEQKEAALREEKEAEASEAVITEEPAILGEAESVPQAAPAGTAVDSVPPAVPVDNAASPAAAAAVSSLAPAVDASMPVATPSPPPSQKRSVFGRLFGRGRSGSMSKDKEKEKGEQVLNEVPPPVPPIPAQVVAVTVVTASTAPEVAPTPVPAPAPAPVHAPAPSAPTPAPAPALPAPAPAPIPVHAPPPPAPALPAPAPAPVPAPTETTTTTVVEETVVTAQPAVPIVQQPQVVTATPAPTPAMPQPAPLAPPHPSAVPTSSSAQGPVVQAPTQDVVAASPPPVLTTTTTTPATATKSKLSKKKTTTAAEESPTKTHHHGGFFGAFRKKKGEEAVTHPAAAALPPTATETIWAPQPAPPAEAALPPSSSYVQGAEGATGSIVSTGSSTKHQRRASRSGTLAALFGLNQHHGQQKKQHQHHVLTKGDRSDAEEGGAAGAEGPQYQVYVNEENLETRRERLRLQHEAGVHHHQNEGSAAKRPQGRVERRTLVQPAGHHARSQSEIVGATVTHQEGGVHRSASPAPALVSVQAPGRVNVEEIQAQARSAMASMPSSGLGGWSTRTEKNLMELQSDSWRNEQPMHTAVAGGGVGRGIPNQFEPVILPDLSDRALRGVEGVQQRPAPQRPTTNPMEYVAKYGGGGATTREGGGLMRNVSVTTAGSGRAGGKLKKGRSSSVPPESDGVGAPAPPRPPVAAAPQAEGSRPFPGGQHRKETSEEVGTGIQRELVKPRRSTSLTTGAPRVVSPQSQNQYGATVLVAGGDQVSGNLARGGWGINQGASLSRNTSVKSNATAPVGGRYKRSPKAQAHTSLGQGIPTSALGAAPPRRPPGGPYPFYGGSQSLVDITPISGHGSGSKTTRTEKRTSVPYPMPNVPGAVTGSMPMTVPKAPPPTSTLIQSGWPGSDSAGRVLLPGPAGATSLLSIVEDVARGNRQAEERLRVLKSGGAMDLEVAQAPTRVHKETLTGAGGSAAVGYKPHHASSASGGSTTSLSQGSGLGRRPSTRPAQIPLKSALRNPSTSRTPSPSNVQRRQSVNVPANARGSRFMHRAEVGDEGEESAYETPGEISGDERGRTLLDGKGKRPIQALSTPVGTSNVNGAQHPPATAPHPASGAPAAVPTSSEVPQRKKSVRVSLQPTFSPTPPAIYDDDDDQRVYWRPIVPEKPVRNKSRFLAQSADGLYTSSPGASTSTGSRRIASTSKAATRDIWQDSDEEDEEYMKARMRLSRALEEEKEVFATARATAAFA
ncbi:hypothetical protein EST38_g6821 [Candolleomyces aberdarensis]|uniref:Uncharacterized protein n=1 Tax=Candolleomyces aberdarensis TaxID=2316362 RepID=A0A4Q2DH68_9AGAR|nr:hypothetical protein EST38_g6821 [Candolleomyces aberdarensis]